MADNTYKVTEIVGTSADGVDEAIRNGIGKASQTLRNLDWFEIVGVRGNIVNGAVGYYQVTMKIGFRIDD
jgi:flavin-binding protein dodecin